MLQIQVLALTLIPLLSGVAPNEGGVPRSPLALLGIQERVESDFMVGTWKCSDDFFRWGITDRKRARVSRFRGKCLMALNTDGTMKMVNLFRPSEGRWEMTDRGLVIYDPDYPERGSQVLPVRKRDENRIWLLLPFAHGSTGIGMIRVTDTTPRGVESQIEEPQAGRAHRSSTTPDARWQSQPSRNRGSAGSVEYNLPTPGVSVEDNPLPARAQEF